MAQVWWLWALFALVVGVVLGYVLAHQKSTALETELEQAQEQRIAALQDGASARAAAESSSSGWSPWRLGPCRTRTSCVPWHRSTTSSPPWDAT